MSPGHSRSINRDCTHPHHRKTQYASGLVVPGASFSTTARVASGVTSRGANPVPPVVTMRLPAHKISEVVMSWMAHEDMVRCPQPLRSIPPAHPVFCLAHPPPDQVAQLCPRRLHEHLQANNEKCATVAMRSMCSVHAESTAACSLRHV